MTWSGLESRISQQHYRFTNQFGQNDTEIFISSTTVF